jgi:hypothetical protein
MRRGKAADVRGAPRLLAEALTTVRAIAPTATIIVRGDSKFYTADVAATAAIAAIPDTAWTPIRYPNAFVDEDTGQLVSDAEVARIPYVAFGSHPKKRQVHGRLIVRRVKRLNPTTGQDGLFEVWRHYAVFVTSGVEMLAAESQHRGHAIIEQVIADAAASALAHLPSGSFPANAAWAVLWAIAHPRYRRPGREVPRPRHHRHHPRPPDQRPGPPGPTRPTADPAPTPAVALGTGLGQPAHRDPPTTRRLNRPPHSKGPDRRTTVEELGCDTRAHALSGCVDRRTCDWR